MITPRPAQLTAANAARFQEEAVVDAYPLRPPYAPEIAGLLVDLAVDLPRAVLDAGAGTGEIARALVDRVARVDAVDLSPAMIAKGRTLPGGDHPRLRWILGPIERVPLQPPYALITAGDSLHWMDWETVMPRFQAALTPNGVLAIVHREQLPPPWSEGLSALIAECSTYPSFLPFDLIDSLEQRGLFHPTGRHETAPIPSRQSIEDYVESFHSRSSLSRAAMGREAATAFDERLCALVRPWGEDGLLDLETVGSIEWGLPLAR